MENLPIESCRSYKEGSWFVFKDKDDWFRLWVGATSGKERFYYNNELLGEKQQRTKLKTAYEYVNAAGDQYEVVLKVSIQFNKAGSICTLTKNGEMIGRVEMLQNKTYRRMFRLILYPAAILYVITSLMIKIGNYSNWLLLIPILYVLFGITYMIVRKVPMIKVADTTDLIDD
jgi:hypothetical protein